MFKEDRELYELRQLIDVTEEIINKLPETGRDKFRNYEYKKYERKLNLSNVKITKWLEHPNPKYEKAIIRMRCKHGIRCRGTRALTTTRPCLALHPCEWEMFSDEYLQYIINLPEQPPENINERILPIWTTNPYLNANTTPILIGCKYAKYCKDGPQCPYLHPRFDTTENNTNTNTN